MIVAVSRKKRIAKLRQRIATAILPKPEWKVEIASLTSERANAIREAKNSSWWDEMQAILSETSAAHKEAVFQSASVEGQEQAVSYNKAVVAVCNLIKDFHTNILEENDRAQKEVEQLKQPDSVSDKKGSHTGLRMLIGGHNG